VSHVVVLALVLFMIWAGFWQLRRFRERGELNRLYAEREELATADASDVIDAGAPLDGGEVDGAVFRRVTATGVYDRGAEVLVRNRTLDGGPGVWVLTPLELGDGTALVVNRGFVPMSGTPGDLPAEAEAPSGEVTVTGLLQPTQERGRFQPTDPAEGTLDVLSRVDLARYQQQVDADLFPAWLLLQEQEPPPTGELPLLLPPPEPFSETRHLSYAVQWFVFTAIAVVGYAIILRRQARHEDDRRWRLTGDPEPATLVGSWRSPG
jgi:cytochrome oxidase assembly protein ShyY1